MNLEELRSQVSSLMDYDPTSDAYKTQVNKSLNEAHEELCARRVWPFMLNEDVVKVNADVELTLGVTNGSGTFTTGAGLYRAMEGRRVVVNGVEMRIAYIQSATTGTFTRDYPGITGSYVCQIQHDVITLPQKTADVIDVAIRDPETNSGRIVPLTRRDDVSLDLDPWQEGTPIAWVPVPYQRTAAPRLGGTPGTRSTGAGKGTRTIDICVTHTFAGIESEPGKVQTITLGDAQDLRVSIPTVSEQSGMWRRIYWRAPDHGVYAWRRATWTVLGVDLTEEPPGTATTADIDLSLTYIESEAAFLVERLQRSGGATRSFRLYPRPGADTVLNVTTLVKPEELAEDADAPRVPEQAQGILVSLAVSRLYLKHGNPAMSNLFAERAEQEISKLEARSLTPVQRRIVKGSTWGQGLYRPAITGTITFIP
jgi:hypothetical protein